MWYTASWFFRIATSSQFWYALARITAKNNPNMVLVHRSGKDKHLHKKWSFPLRISSVKVAKSYLLKKSLMENFIFCAVYSAGALVRKGLIDWLFLNLFCKAPEKNGREFAEIWTVLS